MPKEGAGNPARRASRSDAGGSCPLLEVSESQGLLVSQSPSLRVSGSPHLPGVGSAGALPSRSPHAAMRSTSGLQSLWPVAPPIAATRKAYSRPITMPSRRSFRSFVVFTADHSRAAVVASAHCTT